jgi:antitoxin CptB
LAPQPTFRAVLKSTKSALGVVHFRDPLLALVPAAFSAPQGNFRISKATAKARLRFFAICSAGPAGAWRSLRNRKAGQYSGQLQRISEQDRAQLTPGTECVITSASASNHGTELRRKRLLFHCWHRGTQEIDLIFGTFAETALTGFSTEQLDRFETLLDCDDTDLFDWVTGRRAPPLAHDHDVMRMLRSSCHQKKKG